MAEPSPTSRVDPLHAYRWPLVILALGAMLLAGVLLTLWITRRTYLDTLDRAGQAGQAAAQTAFSIAERFHNGRITQTFVSALPTLSTVAGGHLEVATLEQTETLRAEDARSVFWDRLPLGTTVSEIRVPTTYRYHVDLKEPWQIEVSGQTCIVTAPPLRPSLPPAIHTDRMEKRSDAGWARFNAREQMDALEKNLTPTLSQYAADPRRLSLARDAARRAVAEFVRDWLLKEDHWRTDRFRTIRVLFADEVTICIEPEAQPVPLQ